MYIESLFRWCARGWKYKLCSISFESPLKLVDGATDFMELFEDSEDRLLYIRKVRGFLFWKNNVRLAESSLSAIWSNWTPDFLETKDFKKHYHGDINCLKKQLAKNSINPSDNISSKWELKIRTYPLLFKGLSMNHLTKNKHFKGR